MTIRTLAAASTLLLVASVHAADPPAPSGPPFKSAAELLAAHDRALIRDLNAYLRDNPKADDLDEAYLTLFQRVIERDWYEESEATAQRYLADHPEGAVRPLAQIIATMARARAGRFAEALAVYKELMKGIDKPDQEEFATNFADNLAQAASAAGEYAVSRDVYETLQSRFPDSDTLRQKVRDDLARLDRVGKPAPAVVATDLAGQAVRLSDLKGKYVLIDFWATWCAPCLAELPNLQAAYGKYHGRGFEVIGVSLDETREAVDDFVKARKLPWRQVHTSTGGNDLVDAFGVSTIPATFLIDPDGIVIRLELRGPALEKALSQLIK